MKEKVELKGISVKILVSEDRSVKKTIQDLKSGQLSKSVDIRLIEPSMQTKVSILVIDSKYSLVIEIKDDTQKTSEEAIGLATYSNSKPTVLSYLSIFKTCGNKQNCTSKSKSMTGCKRSS